MSNISIGVSFLKRLSNIKTVVISWAVLVLFLLFLSGMFLIRGRHIILSYAESDSKSFLVTTADKAIINASNNNEITYEKISDISRDIDGNVTSININTNCVNLLKSSISSEITKEISQKNDFSVFVPLGAFINSDFMTGIGKRIRFKVLVSHFTLSDFESRFFDAGINQTLHQILININLEGSVITTLGSRNFTIKTTAIVAQTVIVGKVPSSYTNVIENGNSNTTDKLFNFSDKK